MNYTINCVTVIGAGTMGAAIAAHLANAGIPAYLLDIVPRALTSKEEAKGLTLDHPAVRNRIVNEGWQRCVKARPANLFAKDIHEMTLPEVVEFMKEFGARALGKGVVLCKDTPNFIANRFISIVGAYTLNYVLEHGYTVEEVDVDRAARFIWDTTAFGLNYLENLPWA